MRKGSDALHKQKGPLNVAIWRITALVLCGPDRKRHPVGSSGSNVSRGLVTHVPHASSWTLHSRTVECSAHHP